MVTSSIKRERYAVIDDSGCIFCGLARSYEFKPIDNIGNTAFKTYLSESKAISSFLNSWRYASEEDFKTGRYKVVKVIETLDFVED